MRPLNQFTSLDSKCGALCMKRKYMILIKFEIFSACNIYCLNAKSSDEKEREREREREREVQKEEKSQILSVNYSTMDVR